MIRLRLEAVERPADALGKQLAVLGQRSQTDAREAGQLDQPVQITLGDRADDDHANKVSAGSRPPSIDSTSAEGCRILWDLKLARRELHEQEGNELRSLDEAGQVNVFAIAMQVAA